MARALARLLAAGLLAAGIAAAFAAGWGHARFTGPGPSATPTTVVIPEGTGLAGIARRLDAAGVIGGRRARAVFRLGVRLHGRAGALRAGEYRFPARASMARAMAVLVHADPVTHSLTVAEGRTTAEVVAKVKKADALAGPVTRDPDEGTLLPETYHYRRGTARDTLLKRMRRARADLLDRLWPERAPGLPYDSRREAVILASIVEKETAVPGERPHIAGVFVNRLEKGMRLQSDPTVIYGITRGERPLDRPLTKTDLETATRWNTYTRDGLPPTPICNPGRAAIKAALHPRDTDDLYFVADSDGDGHAFAETLEAHNANVRAWRENQ